MLYIGVALPTQARDALLAIALAGAHRLSVDRAFRLKRDMERAVRLYRISIAYSEHKSPRATNGVLARRHTGVGTALAAL